MSTKQQLGSMMWICVFIAALTSPFWGQWWFGLGVILMAVAAELRKETVPAPRSMTRAVPKVASKPVGTAEQETSAV